MTTAIKRRRGTTAQHATFTGLDGELTIDTTKNTVVVHDGATAGGHPLAREEDIPVVSGINTGDETAASIKLKLGIETLSGSNTGDQDLSGFVNAAVKDASGGFAGLTLFKLNLKNAAGAITSWITTAATAARTWTMPDKDGTVAMTSDITGGTSAGSFTTLAATTSAMLTAPNPYFGFVGTAAGQVWRLGDGTGGTNGHMILYDYTNSKKVMDFTPFTGAVNFIGTVAVVAPELLGYGSGAGGTVTQWVSKSTAVTLNKPCGQITMHAESLAAGATVAFTLNNTLVTTNDMMCLNITGGYGGNSDYTVWCVMPTSNQVVITLKNMTAGALATAVRINFTVIKGATA